MPIYEYRCRGCAKDFEKYVPRVDAAIACPACASADVMRKLSVFGMKTDGSLVPSGAAAGMSGGGGCCRGGCGSTIPGEYVLPALIGQFKTKQADISLVLLVGDSRQVCEWVDDGRVELAIVGARPTQRTLDARELMSDELVVVVPIEHQWATRQ